MRSPVSESLMFHADVAVQAATKAGKQLLANFRRHHVQVYGEDVLSVGNRSYSKEITSTNDHQADEIIIDLIRKRCPDHNILTEETGLVDNGSDYCWVVDPLDGSGNFLNFNPFFAVSIALAHRGQVITGVVFAPFLEEMAVARRGNGCTVNGRPVHVSETTELARTYIVGCPGGDPDNRRFARLEGLLHAQNKDFRKIGSAAIEAYLVAAGRVDAFTTLNISPWDVAAGALCAEEAGGRVTDFHGEPWTLDKTDLLVSNGRVHDQILEQLQEAGIPQERRSKKNAVA